MVGGLELKAAPRFELGVEVLQTSKNWFSKRVTEICDKCYPNLTPISNGFRIGGIGKLFSFADQDVILVVVIYIGFDLAADNSPSIETALAFTGGGCFDHYTFNQTKIS